MLEVADSEAGVRLLRIQDRRHFQRPPQQHSYYGSHPLLPNIYPPHVHNPYFIQPPPPPRQSRYDESVLLNPNRTIADRDVPSDEYLDRNAHRMHQDLYYHPNQVPYHPVNNHFPFPQHQPVPLHPYFPQQNPPKLLNPNGKYKKEKKTREKLLLDPFYPNHNIIQTEDLKKDQKKKQRLLFKRFDSKENSVSENVSIQLLKSNYPQYREKHILPIYVEDESNTEESSIIETNDRGVQIDLKRTPEQSIQALPSIKIQENKREEPKECKDHLFDAFKHSGHLHSRIIDLETYFQILEKQEREGIDNSLLDIAVLNNTNLFPEKPPQTFSQVPNLQTDLQIHNVSNIPLFNSNEQRNPRSNDLQIVYELEDYMPKDLTSSLKKSVSISDKPTVLTYSNTLIHPVQHSLGHFPTHSISNQTIPENTQVEAQTTIEEPPRPLISVPVRKELSEVQPITVSDTEEQKKVIETQRGLLPKPEAPQQSVVTIEEEEPRPPPFEERVIILEEKEQEPTQEEKSIPKPYIPPVYLEKVIYIDDLRRKDSPKKTNPTIDMTPVEIPYYEEHIIHVGQNSEEVSVLIDDDNISVTTIGSQETYQDYLQRIGIDIDSMPFSSEAIQRKLEMQMAISARNSLNFSRGSLLLPSDFDDPNFMNTLSTTLKGALQSTTKDPIEIENIEKHDEEGPSQTETIEKALINILKNSKIKSKLEKLKEANIDTSILNKQNINISEIEEYKKLSYLVETEYMKNADYLIAQTEKLKKETKEAIEKIDTQLVGRNARERFNETTETIYHQRR